MSLHPSLSDLIRVFGRIGLLSFGGPAAQIGLMHRELVEERSWLKEKEFLGALSFCMLLPGPEAMQLATYTGWKLRGTVGGLIGGGLFFIPGAFIIAALAALYLSYGDVPLVAAAFLGVQATVVAIIIQALVRLSGKVLSARLNWIVAAIAFVTLYSGLAPFPAVILLAGIVGALAGADTDTEAAVPQKVALRSTLQTIATWLVIWLSPIAVLWLLDAQFLVTLSLFFSKLAVVTFGGAYAVLAYMVQAVVSEYQWVSTPQMMDALGLAETTPGPLILVTQFTGHLAGYQAGGVSLAVVAGLMTLWCTFTPCFLWIFAGAPYVDYLLSQPRLTGALQMISAAVLGVIANLSLWFTLHLLFADVQSTAWGAWPTPESFQIIPAGLAILACVLLLWKRVPLLLTLALMAVASSLISLV
ncbi:putative chromate transport protein [Shimia thalassica]|uniref:Putative chromate transport protein n=1 Tax=Shimia thalassica TaxID=1715693 RepID=A0A0N7M935_9RHOB|nr:chromate efflux transporter [Shimia thalassica]CUJ94194.1 putative chromate transport protein [Shimia thalassica]